MISIFYWKEMERRENIIIGIFSPDYPPNGQVWRESKHVSNRISTTKMYRCH